MGRRRLVVVAALALACARGPQVSTIYRRGQLSTAVAFTDDGARIVAQTGLATTLTRDAAVGRRFGGPGVEIAALAAQGGRVVTVGRDAILRVFDATTLAPRATFRLDAAGTAVALAGGGALIATGAASGVVCLRRADDGAVLQCLVARGPVTAIAACGAKLAVATGTAVERYALPSLAPRGWLATPALDVAFAPGCAHLAVAGPDAAGALVASVLDGPRFTWRGVPAPPARVPPRAPITFVDADRFVVGWEDALYAADARGGASSSARVPGRVRALAARAGALLVGAWSTGPLDEPSLYAARP